MSRFQKKTANFFVGQPFFVLGQTPNFLKMLSRKKTANKNRKLLNIGPTLACGLVPFALLGKNVVEKNF